MEMTASEWWWAIGQTFLVAAAAFVILCAATSWIRFQLMAESIQESEELGRGDDREFRTAILNQIVVARRLRFPISVLSLHLPDDGVPSGEVIKKIQSTLRSGDAIMPCGKNLVGILLLCGSDKAENAVRRIIEQAGASALAGVNRWRFGVAGYPEHGFKTSVLYPRAIAMAEEADKNNVPVAGMALPEAVADETKTPAELVDALTGLISEDNMISVMRRYIAQERRAEKSVSMAYLDVDQFSRIKEVHGENVSGELIKELAAFLNQYTRESDMIARFGSNGFILAMPIHPDAAMLVAQRLVHSVRKQAFKAGRGIKITLSAGVSGYPDVVGTAVQYFVAAEAALKNAKLRGRNQCVKYDASMPLRSETETAVERL
jgi:diguanylate cyclase (GGDEF)-like protein